MPLISQIGHVTTKHHVTAWRSKTRPRGWKTAWVKTSTSGGLDYALSAVVSLKKKKMVLCTSKRTVLTARALERHMTMHHPSTINHTKKKRSYCTIKSQELPFHHGRPDPPYAPVYYNTFNGSNIKLTTHCHAVASTCILLMFPTWRLRTERYRLRSRSRNQQKQKQFRQFNNKKRKNMYIKDSPQAEAASVGPREDTTVPCPRYRRQV